MFEEKTTQQCLEEVGFYVALEKLRADLKYRGLENEESSFTFESSTSWSILTKKKPSIYNGFGYLSKGEITSIYAYPRWSESQIKEIKKNGYITIYKYDENGELVPSHKSSEIIPQHVIFNCYHCDVGDERNGFLQRVSEHNINFDKLISVLRKDIYWYLDRD
jgi:hypothetical protein